MPSYDPCCLIPCQVALKNDMTWAKRKFLFSTQTQKKTSYNISNFSQAFWKQTNFIYIAQYHNGLNLTLHQGKEKN